MDRSSAGARFLAGCFPAVLFLVAAAEAQSEVVVSEGFRARDRFVFEPRLLGGIGGIAYSPDGDPIVYEGGEIRRHAAGEPQVLARFEPPVFGSFLVLAPDGESLVFGESSEGNLYRVPLAGGGATLVDHVAFAYDLAFGAAGRGYISVLTNNPENEILVLDGDPANANRAVITNIPGLSGPLAFDDAGQLYYGTADFSGDPLRQSVHRFSAAQVEQAVTGEPLDFSAGELLVTEVEGFFSLRWHDGRLFFTDLGFSAGLGAVYVADPEADFRVSLFASFPFEEGLLSPSYLAVRGGSRAFEPGSGRDGGALLVAYSDFFSLSNVVEIEPELWFVRGRINRDERVDIADVVALLSYLFFDSAAPNPLDSGDVNADGSFNVSDAVYLLEYLFQGGAAPPAPFPDPGPAPAS